MLSVIFFYHHRSTTEWEFSKEMCIGHQYKEHLWKINSQRRVADGIDGQYIFRFSWKLIFSTSAKMQTSKRKLKSTTQAVSNVNGRKREINEKMRIPNSNILLTFFLVQKPYCSGKSCLLEQNEREFRYFTKEMTSPKFWPASPRCATGQLFYGPEVAAMHQPSFQHLPRCNQLLYVQEHDLYLERGGFRNLVLTWDFVRKG